MAAAVPVVEAADHRHPSRVRRPHGEAHAGDAVLLQQLRAEAGAEVAVVALGEQVQIGLAEQRAEGVGVLGFVLALRPADAQAIGHPLRQAQAEQPLGVFPLHRPERFAAARVDQLDLLRAGLPGAHQPAVAIGPGAQEGEGVAVLGASQALQVVGCIGHWHFLG
ncbi:hypothetical protein D9M71_158990 [compost metagenome]